MREVADWLSRSKVAKGIVVAHFDADGICSSVMMAQLLRKLGISTALWCVERLAPSNLGIFASSPYDLLAFVDVGSPEFDTIARHCSSRNKRVLVLDHHIPPKPAKQEVSSKAVHVNPWAFGVDGCREVCASSLVYALTKVVDKEAVALSPLAVVGAVADGQDGRCRLEGFNRDALSDAMDAGLVSVEEDAKLLGRETYTALEVLSRSHPFLPGLTGNREACEKLLTDLGVSGSTLWKHVSKNMRKRIVEAAQRFVQGEIGVEVAACLWGEVYTLLNESEGYMTRDAKEYGFLLNACGRQGHFELGIEVCRGDRDRAYSEAVNVFEDDREILFYGVEKVLESIVEERFLRYYTLPSVIPTSMMGAINYMIATSRLSPDKPLVSFVREAGGLRVSIHCDPQLADRGLDVSKAVQTLVSRFGGTGGSLREYGGALLSGGTKKDVIEVLSAVFGRQFDEVLGAAYSGSKTRDA